MKLDLIANNAFGKTFFYPKNEDANRVLSLMRRISFTYEQIKLMQSWGWEVSITNEEFKIIEGNLT